MRARLARLGDAMLGRVLPAAEAGACCAAAGGDCKCAAPCSYNHCTQYVFNCECQCVAAGQC